MQATTITWHSSAEDYWTQAVETPKGHMHRSHQSPQQSKRLHQDRHRGPNCSPNNMRRRHDFPSSACAMVATASIPCLTDVQLLHGLAPVVFCEGFLTPTLISALSNVVSDRSASLVRSIAPSGGWQSWTPCSDLLKKNLPQAEPLLPPALHRANRGRSALPQVTRSTAICLR